MAATLTTGIKVRYCAIRETLDGSSESRFWLDLDTLSIDPLSSENRARSSDVRMPSYAQGNPLRGIAQVKLEMVSVWKRF